MSENPTQNSSLAARTPDQTSMDFLQTAPHVTLTVGSHSPEYPMQLVQKLIKRRLLGSGFEDLLITSQMTSEVPSTLPFNTFEQYRLKGPTEVNLVIVQLSDLGFTDNANWEDIEARAAHLGLGLCPPEVGPELRIAFEENTLVEDNIFVGMEPLNSNTGGSYIFHLAHDSVHPYLSSVSTDSNHTYRPKNRFVFCLPNP